MNDFTLRQSLRALRTPQPPERDLWPEIAARLTARPRRRSWLPLALAASLLAAVPALWLLQDAGPAAVPPAEEMAREADAMSLHYRAALAELSAVPLPPSLRDAAEQLDVQAEQLREALHAHPGSVALLQQLRRTYDQRLRLSQRVALG